MVDRQEEEDMEDMEDTEDTEDMEEAAGAQVEEAVEEELEDPMEEPPIPEVEEEGVEGEPLVEPLGAAQVEEEEEAGPASPALHPPSPILAALVKAKVKTGIQEFILPFTFTLWIAGNDMKTPFLIWKFGDIFCVLSPL